jgi:DNA-binding response OmpR family regulator
MRTPTLLAVDDSEDDALLLKMACRKAGTGFQLRWVEDGEAAAAYLAANLKEGSEPPPDLILLDLNMPRKNGFELLEWLRNHEMESIPVVIYTSSKQESDIERAYGLGAACYLVKPVEFKELLGIVRVLDGAILEPRNVCSRLSLLPSFKETPGTFDPLLKKAAGIGPRAF